MSLYSRAFVRGLRRRVRSETKRRPQWKIEARAARKSARRLTRFSWRGLVPLIAIAAGAGENSAMLALPIILVWSATLMLMRAAEIQSFFFGHSESAPFCQFPVTERFVFWHAARTLLRNSRWLAADVFCFLGTLAVRLKASATISETVLFVAASAIGIWAAALSGAIVLVWIRPRFAFGKVVIFAFVAALAGIWLAAHAELVNPASVQAAYDFAKWLLPTGWVCILIEPWLRDGDGVSFAALALLAAFTVATVVATRKLSATFIYWPSEIEPDGSREDAPEEAPLSRASEVEDAILSRAFLATPDWTGGGFIERTAARWLTPRELRVMSLALVERPRWTRQYPYACVLLLGAPFLAWAARGFVPQPGWMLGLATFIGLGFITPIFGHAWDAFALVPLAHRATAICNLFPVSLRELRSCILKLNLVRFLFALPGWLGVGAAIALVYQHPIPTGLALAGQSWLLALALQPFFLGMKYSASTNDTGSGCLFVIALLLFITLVVGAAGTAVVLSFAPGRFLQWLLAITVTVLLSWLSEAAYRRAWCSRQFDLLAKSGADIFD